MTRSLKVNTVCVLILQHHFLRTPATVTRMDQNNFVLSVPSASGQAEHTADTDESPHAAQQTVIDKLRETLAMSPADASGADPDGLTAIVVHDSYRKLPDPTSQVSTLPSPCKPSAWKSFLTWASIFSSACVGGYL